MITVTVFVVLALLCFAYARSCNGRGPENGCLGAIAFLAGIILIACALLAAVFWLGTQVPVALWS